MEKSYCPNCGNKLTLEGGRDDSSAAVPPAGPTFPPRHQCQKRHESERERVLGVRGGAESFQMVLPRSPGAAIVGNRLPGSTGTLSKYPTSPVRLLWLLEASRSLPRWRSEICSHLNLL